MNRKILLEGLDSLFMKQGLYRELELYQHVANVETTTNTLQNFGSHVNFGAYRGSCNRSFLGHLLVSWWSQAPSLILRFVHVFIFMQYVSSLGIRIIVCHAKGMLLCFKGKSCAYGLFSLHTHVSHSLHALSSQRLLHQEKYVLYVLDGLCCITKCLCVIIVKLYHCLY